MKTGPSLCPSGRPKSPTVCFAERRRRITPAAAASAVERTLALTIEIREVSLAMALGTIAQLARTYAVTVHAAAYLELAMREGLPIATQDADLIAAARRAGLPELA